MSEKEAVKAAKAEKEAKSSNGIIVNDDALPKPVKDLPLIVSPEGGKWMNEAQAEFAASLNAYARQSPHKWSQVISNPGVKPVVRKRDLLLAQLADLGENPWKLQVMKGEVENGVGGKVTYGTKE